MPSRFYITNCSNCHEQNRIPNEPIQDDIILSGICEWCGSSNIEGVYGN